MNKPTDAEIWQMWMPMVRRMGVADPVDFARAVLAKWGTPAPVGVESACQRCRGSGEDPEGYYDQSRGPDGATHDGPCRICAGSGGAPVVLAKWGTPQPTQTVPPAGREPLTDAQIAEMMRDTWGCASIAPRHALEFARVVERAHGIKGGQHGSK